MKKFMILIITLILILPTFVNADEVRLKERILELNPIRSGADCS